MAFVSPDVLMLDYPGQSELQGHSELSGNSAPGKPVTKPIKCTIDYGENVLKLLTGAYLRVGPNPQFPNDAGDHYHWFDGDGMVHVCLIKTSDMDDQPEVFYSSQYVKTYKQEKEEKAGEGYFFKQLSGLAAPPKVARTTFFNFLGRCFEQSVQPWKFGLGTANTSLLFYNNMLWCLNESDLPYGVYVQEKGTLETIGRINPFGKNGWELNWSPQQGDAPEHLVPAFLPKLPKFLSAFPGDSHPVTAHPKLFEGELHTYGYDVTGALDEFLRYTVFDAEGKVKKSFPVSLKEGIFLHHFIVTLEHVVFVRNPYKFGYEGVASGKYPFTVKAQDLAFYILKKAAKDGKSYETITPVHENSMEGKMIFHFANGWDDGGEIVLYALVYDEFEMENMSAHTPQLYRFALDLESKTYRAEGVTYQYGGVMKSLRGELPTVPTYKQGKTAMVTVLFTWNRTED